MIFKNIKITINTVHAKRHKNAENDANTHRQCCFASSKKIERNNDLIGTQNQKRQIRLLSILKSETKGNVI